MRLTANTRRVLEALLGEPYRRRYGFELGHELGIAPPALYPVVSRLSTAGWLDVERETTSPRELGRPPRNLFALNRVGRSAAADLLAARPRHGAPS